MSKSKQKIYRVLALYLAFNMLANLCWPTAAFALTNGPGQPEFQSFEPAGTTEMVNLFTGDFNYNIPLMNVPGPNGGYPINLAYHAGISMEQEASWVGLGWNVNAGAINRAMRGLPDDFNGEKVEKELHFRPNRTANLSLGRSFNDAFIHKEKLGFTVVSYCMKNNISMYYNNYRGVGFGYSFGVSDINTIGSSTGGPHSSPLSLNLSTSSDGIGVNLDISFLRKVESENNEQHSAWGSKAGLSWGSREGLTSLSLGMTSQKNNGLPLVGGLTFSKSAYTPVSTPEMTGVIATLGIALGYDSIIKWCALKATSLNASYTETEVKHETDHQYAFGYLHEETAGTLNGISDINHEKDVPPTRQTKTLGVPVATYDVYSVSGQGVGGSFRPYRSDIGIYSEPHVMSTIFGGRADLEFGYPKPSTNPPNIKFGANASFTQSKTYSGFWYDQWWSNADNEGTSGIMDFKFQTPDPDGALDNDHAYEPFYFKMSGEQTASPSTQLDFIGGDAAVRFNLKEKFELLSGTDIAVRPEIPNSNLYTDDIINEAGFSLSSVNKHRLYREKRVVSNQSYTNGQLNSLGALTPNVFSTFNSFPAIGGSGSFSVYSYPSGSPDQIGQFTEVSPDGNRYVYGLPVYNKETKDVFFAQAGAADYPLNHTRDFTSTQASLSNEEGHTDQLFSSTTVPGYAESYLLTAIFSPDYVDVTGDGPSEDDLGYYVKFNYVKSNDAFKWRAPYWDGVLNKGYLSDKYDDKLSYEYGEKEVYYLHSIETKTHVACFFLDNDGRKDGHEAISETACDNTTNRGDVVNKSKTYSLDSIALYSKADPNYGTSAATPLKTVHFTYDYSLCPGVYNNENITSPSGDDRGKLTLKSIYFTYLNNYKGKLSPYEFEYQDNSYQTDFVNPGFDPEGNDRWGVYKKQEPTSKYRNDENPYVDQHTANRAEVDQSAAAWCLKSISLPSGSTININYEADDYAFVQDQRAMQMCRVVGTCKDDQDDIGNISDKIGRQYTRIIFELNEVIPYASTSKEAKIQKYIQGMDQMYFKIFTRLKKKSYETSVDAYDYVEGYCRIKDGDGWYGVINDGTNDHQYGFLTVELVDRDDYPGTSSPIQANPIQKAGWQYLYLNRPDLFVSYDPVTGTLSNLITAATGMLTEIPRAVLPYTTADARFWCNKMNTDENNSNWRPSYIRLYNPNGIKAGGGHRVKSILMSDKWNALSGSVGSEAKYGISYSYRLPDGRSSGVASYEPMIGGEEIALRKPIRYDSDNLVKKDQAFYVEEPMGESYFPAPVVGYSRVVVKSIVGNNNQDAGSEEIKVARAGQTVYEFYTAKDYPVICDRTNLQKTWFPLPIFLPYIGAITYNNRGFSQGYSIVLNDMHGKLKAVSTYPAAADLSLNPMPVRRVVYRYNGGYDERRANQLSSTVTVLTADGDYGQANLGETYDFYIDAHQHSNETKEYGGQFNTNINTINGFTIPIFLPIINITRSLNRSVVAMKVIYRTGILTEVETLDDGAKSTAKNLMFDGETGQPLLTSVTNEFEKPVYTYNYAAHWAYDGMKGAYHNIGSKFGGVATDAGGVIAITGADSYFFPGDEVLFTPSSGSGEVLWVSAVNSSSVTFIDDAGGSPGVLSGTFTIIRSGYRNQQAVSNGTIVSLSNPLENRNFPLFDLLNAQSSLTTGYSYNYVDCATGLDVTFNLTFDDHHLYINRTGGGTECTGTITFPSSYTLSALSQLDGCDFHKTGSTVAIDFPSDPDLTGTWSDEGHCFNECLQDVLHAAAVRFNDNWSMDFNDAGLSGITGTYNQYRFAEKGVWRTESNYLYQVDRQQSTDANSVTDISRDGMYQTFTPYNWKATASSNPQWSFVSQITRYSPYGYALESKDALGVYSSTMFGYDNTKQTASAANCPYFEMGFDGFEDYTGTDYFGHGHLGFEAANLSLLPALNSGYAHSGKNSLAVYYGGDAEYSITCDGTISSSQQYFEPTPGAEYNLSVWVRAVAGGTPYVIIDNGSGPQTFSPDNAQSPIEGWQRIDARFTAPSSGNTLSIKLHCHGSGTAFFDDIRVQPFKSAMTSYVYDPQTHWLLAQLDNRNFATFYNYDEEGSLVQVKQETEKGIFTVQTSRGNIKRQ